MILFNNKIQKALLSLIVLCSLAGCQTFRDQSPSDRVSVVGEDADILFDTISVSNDDCNEEQCVEYLKTLKYSIVNKSTVVEASQSCIPVTISAKSIQLYDYLTILSHHFNLKFTVEKQKTILVITVYNIIKG